MKTLIFKSLFLGLVIVSAEARPEESIPLFNGKDFSGWVKHGGTATFTIDGDEIVGTTALDTPSAYLCTEKNYGDFILEYDFKADPLLKSGVTIRSQYSDSATEIEWEGKPIKIVAGRVHGYNVEHGTNRWWVASLYDGGRRSFLYPGVRGGDGKAFTEQGQKVIKPGEWNHIRVEAAGDSIKTWLNGVPRADIHDSFSPRGFIALQLHNIGTETDKLGRQVRWRNLKFTDRTPPQIH
jgi:hypothetical protein